MNYTKRPLIILGSVVAMLLLILDAGTALQGAKVGIEIVLGTIVPTLFPFIYISSIVNRTMGGRQVPFMRWLGKICGIPQGSEILLLLGFTSGYPVGAKMINDCCVARQLDIRSARRMLGFCNNAGPAFIFGILLPVFTRPITVFLLWLVHVLSAILTAVVLPGKASKCNTCIHRNINGSYHTLLLQAEKAVAEISGLVILFRILIAFLDKYILWQLPVTITTTICGLLELSNGCIILHEIDCEPLRLIISACMISAGGICVFLQTVAVTKSIGSGMYLPGKLIQSAMCYIMIVPIAMIIYRTIPLGVQYSLVAGIPICALSIVITRNILKKHWKSEKT